jgi:signal transduction histidine kinase
MILDYNQGNTVEINADTLMDYSDKPRSSQMDVESINMLLLSDRSNRAFIARINHEFRTSLNAVMGFAQILKTGNVGEDELKSYSEIICMESDHLLMVFNKILNRLTEGFDMNIQVRQNQLT